MDGTNREQRWIFYYRVLTLGAVAFLLPPLVPIAPAQVPYLALAAVGFLVLWLLLWAVVLAQVVLPLSQAPR